MKKYIPNSLTILRGILTICIILLFFLPIPYRFWFILFFFFVASLTDFLDGHLARRWEAVSDFGIVFDSLFDKILTLSLYLLLIPYEILPLWVWVLFFIREMLVDGMKNFCLGKGCPISALKSGKWKFTFQVILLHGCLLLLLFPKVFELQIFVYVTAAISMVLAYVSAFLYARDFFRFLRK
ncbi:CDP-diacylglycerol--glycerol-3-phosphate 3-phosphatidyltransferase [Candidatus Gracilibacteria bacterium]|nr:CDP-diacylglycerol--glycerol-3-phosphate 3-phosphatidyltransferase [Candidatus Gracilibacteria bacterium]MCF7819230.1 CDP-diacylglycerol--glycerol-3-phosphate 3-phosphatidyltransferase [Candidatus Gracilibacteria bacterium]